MLRNGCMISKSYASLAPSINVGNRKGCYHLALQILQQGISSREEKMCKNSDFPIRGVLQETIRIYVCVMAPLLRHLSSSCDVENASCHIRLSKILRWSQLCSLDCFHIYIPLQRDVSTLTSTCQGSSCMRVA